MYSLLALIFRQILLGLLPFVNCTSLEISQRVKAAKAISEDFERKEDILSVPLERRRRRGLTTTQISGATAIIDGPQFLYSTQFSRFSNIVLKEQIT